RSREALAALLRRAWIIATPARRGQGQLSGDYPRPRFLLHGWGTPAPHPRNFRGVVRGIVRGSIGAPAAGGAAAGGSGAGGGTYPVEVTITTVLPRSACEAGWVPTASPTWMLYFTSLPPTGLNPAAVRAAMASFTDIPAMPGTDT